MHDVHSYQFKFVNPRHEKRKTGGRRGKRKRKEETSYANIGKGEEGEESKDGRRRGEKEKERQRKGERKREEGR